MNQNWPSLLHSRIYNRILKIFAQWKEFISGSIKILLVKFLTIFFKLHIFFFCCFIIFIIFPRNSLSEEKSWKARCKSIDKRYSRAWHKRDTHREERTPGWKRRSQRSRRPHRRWWWCSCARPGAVHNGTRERSPRCRCMPLAAPSVPFRSGCFGARLAGSCRTILLQQFVEYQTRRSNSPVRQKFIKFKRCCFEREIDEWWILWRRRTAAVFVVQVLLTKILSINVKMLSIARYVENIVKIS